MPIKLTTHAMQRRKERNINTKTPEDIIKFPIYGTDNGCTKYLDMENLVVYYIRTTKNIPRIVTMISCVDIYGKPNPIQMLRYYAEGVLYGHIESKYSINKGGNFYNYCRDNVFKDKYGDWGCKRGSNCKYIHVN
jgi:hypothetical protein